MSRYIHVPASIALVIKNHSHKPGADRGEGTAWDNYEVLLNTHQRIPRPLKNLLTGSTGYRFRSLRHQPSIRLAELYVDSRLATMLVSLSLEVIDNILIQLSDSRDVCNVRLVCKALAELGLRHLAPRVTLVRLPKAFDRLLAIANHPVISYHVVEVIYYVDGVPEPPKHRGPGFEHLSRRRKSFTDWQTAHSEFIRHEQEADESILLLQAFQRFPRLTSLKISNLRDYVCEPAVNSYERHPYSHWPASEFGAGKYSLLAPAQDETVSYGSKLVNLLGAACITSLELRQLSLDRLEPEALSDYTSTVKHEVMKDMFGSLHKLRLILTHSLDTDNPRETWQRVGLQDLIWSSPYLDHLEIAVRNHCGELNQQLSFQFMFEGRHWRQLSALHLEEFETKPELLTEFLRAHA